MENFTPLPALLGGGLIGLAAAILLLLNGRVAGVSGIVGDLLRPAGNDLAWRIAFVAGLLVGFGTSLGSGCTSGHGVCGIARLSPRSLTATAVFMLAGMITVYIVRHVVI